MPHSADLPERVAAVVATVFGIEPGEVDRDLEYGGIAAWDSVGHLDLLLALERKFGFQLTTELIPKLTSIRAIEAFLVAHASE